MLKEHKFHSSFLAQKGHALDGRVTQTKLNRRHVFETFQEKPAALGVIGVGAVAAADATVALLRIGRNVFERYAIGDITTTPSLGTYGLEVTQDEANDEGCEITCGITSRSKLAFTIGTDQPFFFRCKVYAGELDSLTSLIAGFRKTQAYQTDYNDYTDFAAIGGLTTASAPADIQTTTALNNAATVNTDTGLNWAEGETHTLEVRVSAGGAVTYWVDGQQNTVSPAFTFDSGDVVVPFFRQKFSFDPASPVELVEWECGMQETGAI